MGTNKLQSHGKDVIICPNVTDGDKNEYKGEHIKDLRKDQIIRWGVDRFGDKNDGDDDANDC